MVPTPAAMAARCGRKYLETHPWINFEVPTQALATNARFWMHMGAAQSKCTHVARSPLKPDLARKLHETAITKGARSTTAIEGNTLTEEQIEKAVRGELEVPPSQEHLKAEAQNVIAAFNDLEKSLIQDSESLTLTVEWLNEQNARLLEGTDLKEGVVPGEIRDGSVGVGTYRGAPAEDCRFLLQTMCDWINGPEMHAPDDARRGVDVFFPAFMRATLAHLYIAWIHPYGDGNGRLARLVEFAILIEAGVPMTTAHLLSHHYNITRNRYYARLDESSRMDPNTGAARFLAYAAEGFVDQLAEQVKVISSAVFGTTWREFIYDSLPANTEPERRRRQVALNLPPDIVDADTGYYDIESWTPRSKIPELTTKLAAMYAGTTSRTLSRDLNALAKSGHIVRQRGRVAAYMSQLQQTLPRARDSHPDGSPID